MKGHIRQISGERLVSGNVASLNGKRSALSAKDGSYRFAVPTADGSSVTIVGRRIGFMPVRLTFDLTGLDSVEIDFKFCRDILQLNEAVVTGAASVGQTITNTQHAGVDEGGIAKLHGDYLVVLRRGRLYTIAIAGERLAPVSHVDAFAPGVNSENDWYDELLVSGDRVVVIGYSYARGGTEIGVFSIDAGGRLSHLSTYHLRSDDYYSSRNYASRLIGTKLLFYDPMTLSADVPTIERNLPSMRKWKTGAGRAGFTTISSPRRVYRPVTTMDPSEDAVLHSVVSCDLATVELTCESNIVIGPRGRVFYVSPHAVYAWVNGSRRRSGNRHASATVYRLPLDGSPPSAIRAQGNPVDHLSFLETDDARLNVLVFANGSGEGMWDAERRSGTASLLQVPIGRFGNGKWKAPRSAYRALPPMPGPVLQNRFIGTHLLFGSGNGWGPQATTSSMLTIVPLANGPAKQLAVPHGIDRIEPLGSEAMVIGADGSNLHFAAIQFDGSPSISKRLIRDSASQGELRSHGFFYRPDGAGTGILGLPIRRPGRPGYEHLFDNSASVLFISNADSLRYSGELVAEQSGAKPDRCMASCVDWYGNARPIFVGPRIFALMGYELVEGRYRNGKVEEKRRVDFR